MERFEEMCRMYLNGSEEVKETILSFLTEEERKTFIEGVAFYKLFTQPTFYKAVRDALAEEFYKENHK